MSCILGISIDTDGVPSIRPQRNDDIDSRFGMAWFSTEGQYATIIKDLHVREQNSFQDALYEGQHIAGSTFICSYYTYDGSQYQKNMPPFRMTFAGRDWVVNINGEFCEDFYQFLQLDQNPFFKPTGTSHEEYVFYWLMERIFSQNITSLSELRWSFLHELFKTISKYGSVNILLSDGQDLVIYHGQENAEPLYAIQSFPQHLNLQYNFKYIEVSFDNEYEHTFFLITNQKPVGLEDHALSIIAGQMVVVRSGAFVWDSHANLLPKTEFLETTPNGEEVTAEPEPKQVSDANPRVLNQTYLLPLKGKIGSESVTMYLSSASKDQKPHILAVTHDSIYRYSADVTFSKHLFRLKPLHDLIQNVLYYNLSVSVNGKACSFFGAFGNSATIFDVTETYRELRIHSKAIVSVSDLPPQRYDMLHQQFTIPLIWMPWDRTMLQAYLSPPELSEAELYELSNYAMSFVKRNNHDVIEILNDINRTIHREYTYMSGATSLATTSYDIYFHRCGVCQDFANLFICLARLLNIPARYRVGYIYTGTDYANKVQSEASHAWVEVYIPNIGWLGFDPTNGCPQTKDHIRVACGRNYQDATPTSGTIFRGGGIETLATSVKVILLDTVNTDVFN